MERDIYSYDLSDLEAIIADFGLPRFRAKQLHEWLHTHNATSYDQMTNLPKALREQLSRVFPLSKTTIAEKALSRDGTRKYLFTLHDGSLVESVGIPEHDVISNVSRETFDSKKREADNSRLTVCFSTQVGCGMNCAFCATGHEGFSRNLTVQEMVDQVVAVQNDFNRHVSNIVAMGQGEPFLNYDNVIAALRRFNNDKGICVGARHITVSTCGIRRGIERFAHEPEQFTLAVSLHSAIQDKRDQLMPALKNQPLDELREAVDIYLRMKRRRVTFEYLMIDNINDGTEDLIALRDYCSGLLCHVNLIPLNPVDNIFTCSSDRQLLHWKQQLEAAGISTTIRQSKGADIAGACGQLKNVSRETF